jgi:hypothetical protein
MQTKTFDSHAGAWTTARPSTPWLRRHRGVVLPLAIVLALAFIAVDAVDEPLRRQLEHRINASLDGYTGTIGRAHLHVFGLSLDLYDVTVVQNALPDSPVIYIPRWTTSVQWRALLTGAVVADVRFERPAFYATLGQAATEASDATPVTDRGWQDAVTAVYPLEINRFRIVGGSLAYFDTGRPPVRLARFSLEAENIRNVRSVPGRYPSPVTFDGTLADGARLALAGRADFLAEPHATVRGAFSLRGLTLAPLAPALRHLDLSVTGGRLGARGHVEYTAKQTRLALDRLTVASPRIDYVRRGPEQDRAVAQATRETTTAKDRPRTRVDITQADVTKATLGLVDTASTPPYRVTLEDVDAHVRQFSNERAARRGSAYLQGRLTRPGWVKIDTDFAPGASRPDFRMNLRLEDLDLPALNDYLRAQAGFDVVAGRLSVYSEIAVRDGSVTGYVKPLFYDVSVYDWNQDREKPPLRQLYEAAVGAAASVLTNHQRENVATITDLSGPVESPDTDTWQIIGGLLQNAFVKSILPGLEPHGNGAGR